MNLELFNADWLDKKFAKYSILIEKMSNEFNIELNKFDLEKDRDFLIKRNIKEIPSVLLIDNEIEIDKMVGVSLIKPLRNMIRKGING